jgi:DNA-binding transcriptional ArsR family regulator
MKSIVRFVDKAAAPSLLPVLRSQQQGEILALLLGDPDLEVSLSEIARRTGAPHPSVHREVERAERAGLVTSRKVGNTRLVRADTASPYYGGLAEVLTRAFGVPAVLAGELRRVRGISAAYVYGSWAARHAGQQGERPVGDIDVLVLGEPDRDQLYAAAGAAEERLGRPVQVTIREASWLESGSGSFHQTVTSRPALKLDLPATWLPPG